MSLTVQGKLFEIFDEAQVTDKFKKREFVLEIADGSYTQYPKFQMTQDKCSLLDNFNKGEEVTVTFNLSGKPFTKNGETMYFTNLQAWRIDKESSSVSTTTSQMTTPGVPSFYSDDAENDLPF
jgi:single-strand DNA-binding protein